MMCKISLKGDLLCLSSCRKLQRPHLISWPRTVFQNLLCRNSLLKVASDSLISCPKSRRRIEAPLIFLLRTHPKRDFLIIQRVHYQYLVKMRLRVILKRIKAWWEIDVADRWSLIKCCPTQVQAHQKYQARTLWHFHANAATMKD